CGRPVRKDNPPTVWEEMNQADQKSSAEVLVTFQIPASDKLSANEMLELIAKQGYQRILLPGGPENVLQVVRVEEAGERLGVAALKYLIIIQDRVKLGEGTRGRFIEACEQAYHLGKGRLAIYSTANMSARSFSNRLHCAACDLEYRPATVALFSFNHPL